MLERVLLPGLAECTVALDALVADAEAIVASIFVFAAPIVAEKRRLPLFSVILQAMAMLSPWDPPRTVDFRMTARAPDTGIGAGWNRFAPPTWSIVYTVIGSTGSGGEHRLPTAGAANLLAHRRPLLRLECYSSLLGALPPDAAHTT